MEAQWGAIAITAIFGITAVMFRMWLRHAEKMKGLSSSKQDTIASDARLERLEQAVESIAIEIERVSEGQRYVTKLMSEKAQPVLGEARVGMPVQARRIDTPH
jgi:hypothetical protein